MKTLKEYIDEAQESVYAVVDKDLGIMSVWNTETDANKEKEDRLGENSDLKLDVKKMRKSEVEQKDAEKN